MSQNYLKFSFLGYESLLCEQEDLSSSPQYSSKGQAEPWLLVTPVTMSGNWDRQILELVANQPNQNAELQVKWEACL